MKRIPYGISNYKTIALENYVYVDKTPYIEKMEQTYPPFLFFLRPRRFGKSLFTSILANYYDVKEKDNFDALFGKTYIGQKPTSERNGYYVLNFDFSGVTTDTAEKLEQSFASVTANACKRFQKRYGFSFDFSKEGSPADILDGFMADVEELIDKPIFVIIDEYDHFANELLSFRFDLFKQSVSGTGFVRKWYEILKKTTKTVVKRIFATGVSPITLDSLTSGFNIATNITLDEEFNEMMGFTEEDVRFVLSETEKTPLEPVDLEDLMETLKKNYNGYLFNEGARTRLFNSDMILYYLKTFVEYGKGPDELIDENIASDYGKLGRIFELKDKAGNLRVLEDILGGEPIPARMTRQFSMEKDFTRDDFKSLLFYLGLLTIEQAFLAGVKLVVPNYVIKGLYFDYFVRKINESIDYAIDTSIIEEAMAQIALEGKNDKFVSLIEETLGKLSNRDFIRFDEKYVKLIMLAYFMLSGVYMVKSEYEAGGGYIDIALLPRESIEPDYFAIMEIKYLKQSDYDAKGQALAEEKKAEAVRQIGRYAQSPELTSLPRLKKWALVFAGDKCVVSLEV